MRDYSLLKNKVYLILLAYYNNQIMPSYVELGKKAGITRQTASTRIKELLNNKIISVDNDNILNVSNPLEINEENLVKYLNTSKSFDPIKIKNYLFGTSNNHSAEAKELNISRSNFYREEHSVVYGIVVEGKVKYVGTSEYFEVRIQQHIKKRPFLTPDNFIIFVDNSNLNSHRIEKELIHLLQPEWNIMSKN